MTTAPQTDTAKAGDPHDIQVKVDYLPAAAPFHDRLPPETPATDTVAVAASDAPCTSVTVSETVKVPAAVNVCDGCAVQAGRRRPSHSRSAVRQPRSRSRECAASRRDS